MADFVIKQGDTSPVLSDTLTYSDSPTDYVNLTGASVQWVMRALTANAWTTDATATIVNATGGQVSYTFTAVDSAVPGSYMGNWVVTFSGGAVMTFPTDGYVEVEVQQNLTTPGGAAILSLGDVKNYLNIPAQDRSHDAKLLTFIAGITPVVENIVGPVLQHDYSETYDGGFPYISLRHRPVIRVDSVVMTLGPIQYNMTQVPTPAQGTIYSYMFQPPGRVVRRAPGGGIQSFPAGYDQVLVTYTAGRVIIPENIRQGSLELIRTNYQKTQQAGPRFGGGEVMDDALEDHPALGFFVSGRVRELLSPSRRHPSIA